MRGELVLLSGFLFYHTKQLHSVFSGFINQKFVYFQRFDEFSPSILIFAVKS